MFQSSIGIGSARTFERLVAGLEIEFGMTAAEGLARQFIDAEDPDFYWEERAAERRLCSYESLESDDEVLDRIAVMSELDGRHFVAVVIAADGKYVQAMLGLRHFGGCDEARAAFETAR